MPAAPRWLRAGPLRLLYEPDRGWIRRIRWRDREVLRAIYPAVRDRNWDTIPATFSAVREEIRDDSFILEFTARHVRDGIDFEWRGVVQGGADGSLRYSFHGKAVTSFLRNRIGLCVLHPLRECVGAPAVQKRVDGWEVTTPFPDRIEPQIVGAAGFRDLRSLGHPVAPGVWAEVLFEGDVFETEDQRNWTDASFKTYSTPLARPFPVEIAAGTQVRQSVALRLLSRELPGARPRVEAGGTADIAVRILPCPGSGIPLPRIGLALAGGWASLNDEQVARLRALGLAHLRVDVRLEDPTWRKAWEHALREARRVGVGLEVALHLPRDGRVDESEVRRGLDGGDGVVVRVLALRTGEPATTVGTLGVIRRWVEGWNVPVGAGSDAHFCELNREHALGRCAVQEADFLFWPVTPQVHAFDDLSVMENLEGQAATVWTARAFAGSRPLVVSPVTLRPRFNAVAAKPWEGPIRGEMPDSGDPRQAVGFGAAWTVGSIAELTRAGCASLTCFETVGACGIMETDEGSRHPGRPPLAPGSVFPVYRVLAALGAFVGGHTVPVASSEPGAVAALAVRDGARCSLLLANLEAVPRAVDVGALPEALGLKNPFAALEWIGSGTGVVGRTGAGASGLVVLPPYSALRLGDGG